MNEARQDFRRDDRRQVRARLAQAYALELRSADRETDSDEIVEPHAARDDVAARRTVVQRKTRRAIEGVDLFRLDQRDFLVRSRFSLLRERAGARVIAIAANSA